MSEQSERGAYQIELTEKELAFIIDLLDSEMSCNDIDRQDRAYEILKELPEVPYSAMRGL